MCQNLFCHRAKLIHKIFTEFQASHLTPSHLFVPLRVLVPSWLTIFHHEGTKTRRLGWGEGKCFKMAAILTGMVANNAKLVRSYEKH